MSAGPPVATRTSARSPCPCCHGFWHSDPVSPSTGTVREAELYPHPLISDGGSVTLMLSADGIKDALPTPCLPLHPSFLTRFSST